MILYHHRLRLVQILFHQFSDTSSDGSESVASSRNKTKEKIC